MDFYIKKGSTLPKIVLKPITNKKLSEEDLIFLLSNDIYVYLYDLSCNKKIFCGLAEVYEIKDDCDDDCNYNIRLSHQLKSKFTKKENKYYVLFEIKTNDGNYIFPVKEKIYVNVIV